MKIGAPELVQENGNLRYQVPVDGSEGSETLWYSLSAEYADLVSQRSDAALVALLIPAMARGEDIHLAGPISEKLYYNLSGPYQRILQSVIPSLRPIRIYPVDVQTGTQRASGVATGFSAGIDSFSVLADHYYGDVPAGFRVTHLLYNNVGAHVAGAGRDPDQVFQERYSQLKPYVEEQIGLPFIAVSSNLTTFYSGFSFQKTHTPRNTSVALLLQQGIGRYLYASTYHYEKIFVGSTYDMAYSDPITLPLLSTETLEAFSAGSQYTRVEKTLKVAEIEDSYRLLDVCVYMGNTRRNCSTCEKCLRTLLTLEIAGVLDRYQDAFDLDAYRRVRDSYIIRVHKRNDPFSREIVQFARFRNFNLPPYLRFLISVPKGEGAIREAGKLRAKVGKLISLAS
jgi:hypothetical protein